MMDWALQPLLPWPVLVFTLVPLALWCWYEKFWLRGLLLLVVLVVSLQPQQQVVERQTSPSQVVVVTDLSRSQQLQRDEVQAWQERLLAVLKELPNAEVTLLSTADTPSLGSQPLADALGTVKRLGQDVGGVILLTDGLLTDLPQNFPVALHTFLLPHPGPDLSLELVQAPAYALVGQRQEVALKLHGPKGSQAQVQVALPEQEVQRFDLYAGDELRLPFTLSKAGTAALTAQAFSGVNETITANNQVAHLVTGVRENLKVLLITGEPHNGTRSLRQVFKGDASVNLVHFAILRTFFSRMDAPREEMSLIPFPVDKLFGEQLADFDLVVFDNFITQNLGLEPYYDNIQRYVREGGSLLVLGNQAMTDGSGLLATPLASLLPITQAEGLRREGFTPRLTADGAKHPVTAVFAAESQQWGPLGERVLAQAMRGYSLLDDGQDNPLLILSEVEEGRVATLLTSQLWLWGRQTPGGPHTELVKRLAHWLMRAPSLEGNQLQAAAAEGKINLRYLGLTPPETLNVTLIPPVGEPEVLSLTAAQNWQHSVNALHPGLYQFTAGALKAYAVVGDSQDREWHTRPQIIAELAELSDASGGRLVDLRAEGLPTLRIVQRGRDLAGRGWAGISEGTETKSVLGQKPLFTPGGSLILLLVLIVATWAQEAGLKWPKRK